MTDAGDRAILRGMGLPAELDALTVGMVVNVRGIVDANVATLSAFAGVTGGTAVNGVTYTEGDIVLLVKQTTAAQNGFYIVGTVANGTAPLTRPSWWATGALIQQGVTAEVGIEDTLYPGSTWKALAATATKVIGTDDPVFYPKVVKGQKALGSGTTSLGSTEGLWLTSTAHASVNLVTAGGTLTSTTGWRCSARTAGIIGSAAATIIAHVAAGSVNSADTSTVEWMFTNW